MMNLIIFVFAILSSFNSGHEVNLDDSSLQMLAGASQKSWYLYSKTPEDVSPSCKANSPQSLDNNWIFFANGTFEFSRGTITQDTACMDKGCCSDMLNIIGSWAFTNNESGLKIMMLHQKEKPSNSFNDVLMDGTLLQLAADKFIIKLTGANSIEYTLEFRAR